MIKAVFFDLDGTLLPMDENEFVKVYFGAAAKKAAPYGYEPKQLVDVIWTGTKKMFVNDGTKTNHDVFWDYFVEVYGKEKLGDRERIFDEFYKNEFKGTKAVCKENPLAKSIVAHCKEKTGFVALTTNPVFPFVGTETRMGFVGLTPADFDLVTTYEDFHYCKPNPKYFSEVLEKTGLKAEEVVLIGNNTLEDGACAAAVGIKCYLTGEFIIRSPKTDMEFPYVAMEDIPALIDELCK